MKWIRDLSIRNKLLMGFVLVLLLLLGVIALAYTRLSQINEFQKQLSRDFTEALDLTTVIRYQDSIRARQLDMLMADTPVERERRQNEIREREQIIDKLFDNLRLLYQNQPRFLEKIQELERIDNEFKQVRQTQVIPLIHAGKQDEAKKLVRGPQLERFEKIRDIAIPLQQEALRDVELVMQQSERIAEQAVQIFFAISLAAVLVCMMLTAVLNRIIANPLKRIADSATLIASGNLATPSYVIEQADEVGRLSQAFHRMSGYLKETANAAERIAAGDLRVGVKPLSEQDLFGRAFARMIDNLKSTTAELTEGVNVLAAAASEILTSTTQVASGVAETATAISQTTATVEEVKQAGLLSSQKAKHVADSAQKANEVTQGGIQAVTAAIDGMNRVQDQVASVAQSIVTLSEQSQAIGEIIATVNDLAEQSNLLAVNASIEAAKAGEQGKGFTVVAQEIRSLAEQSKQATVQVRQILNDIQKATGAAVIATEQGTKTVEVGMRQSQEAGESIRLLGATVSEASQAAVQIAASSQQQLAGMDQVALAMENIKTASTQNVSSTRQTETAAQNLHELGQKIKLLVERYQV